MSGETTLLRSGNSKLTANQQTKISLAPQTTLNNRYVIKKSIFQNENFIGYLAFDNIIKSNIIIKEFFPTNLVSRHNESNNILINSTKTKTFELAKKNFIQIFKTLQKFRANPSIIKIFAVFSENNTIYCVQEIPEGLSLKKFLSNNYGELNWEQSKKMFIDLIRFLHSLHSCGIVHGGLSPETILVQNNNKLKIIDFSNAIYNSKQCVATQKLYDGYAPVEQYQRFNIGTFTDVYSLAAIIYKSLTGTKPVSSTSRLSNDNLLPPKSLNHNIPKNVSVSIMSALIISSKMRTQTMSDFCDDLTAKSRDYYNHQYSDRKEPKIRNHINTIEPIKKKKVKVQKEMKTRNIIFIAMLISSSVVLFTAAIIIFILFQKPF